jgi:hypothetical protein
MIHEQRRLLDLEQRMRHHPEVHPWEDSG